MYFIPNIFYPARDDKPYNVQVYGHIAKAVLENVPLAETVTFGSVFAPWAGMPTPPSVLYSMEAVPQKQSKWAEEFPRLASSFVETRNKPFDIPRFAEAHGMAAKTVYNIVAGFTMTHKMRLYFSPLDYSSLDELEVVAHPRMLCHCPTTALHCMVDYGRVSVGTMVSESLSSTGRYYTYRRRLISWGVARLVIGNFGPTLSIPRGEAYSFMFRKRDHEESVQEFMDFTRKFADENNLEKGVYESVERAIRTQDKVMAGKKKIVTAGCNVIVESKKPLGYQQLKALTGAGKRDTLLSDSRAVWRVEG